MCYLFILKSLSAKFHGVKKNIRYKNYLKEERHFNGIKNRKRANFL